MNPISLRSVVSPGKMFQMQILTCCMLYLFLVLSLFLLVVIMLSNGATASMRNLSRLPQWVNTDGAHIQHKILTVPYSTLFLPNRGEWGLARRRTLYGFLVPLGSSSDWGQQQKPYIQILNLREKVLYLKDRITGYSSGP